jgi:hypothetical protein
VLLSHSLEATKSIEKSLDVVGVFKNDAVVASAVEVYPKPVQLEGCDQDIDSRIGRIELPDCFSALVFVV